MMVTQYMPYPALRYEPPPHAVAAVGIAARTSSGNNFEDRLKAKKKQEVKGRIKKKKEEDRDTYEHALPETEDMYAMERAEKLLW